MKYPSGAMGSSAIVGVAGLGSRGRAMGNRLRAAGRRVLGFDDDVQAAAGSGLRTAGSSERLAQECELELVSCDGELAERLVRELLEFDGITNLTTIALCGALEPRRVRELAEACAARGIALVDAPLDGGEDDILSGTAIVFAGGTEPAIEGCRTLLETFGTVVEVGEAGSGQLARTVNDVLRWANVLAVQDAFRLVRAAGGDASPIRDAVLRASGANRALEEWGRANVDTARQDLAAALLLARETAAGVPLIEGLEALLDDLDPDEMAALFNAGIADLSAHGPEAPAPAAWDETLAGAPEADALAFGEPLPDEAAPAFGEPPAEAAAAGFGEPLAEGDAAGFGEPLAGAGVASFGESLPEGEAPAFCETLAEETAAGFDEPLAEDVASFGEPLAGTDVANLGESPGLPDAGSFGGPLADAEQGFGDGLASLDFANLEGAAPGEHPEDALGEQPAEEEALGFGEGLPDEQAFSDLAEPKEPPPEP